MLPFVWFIAQIVYIDWSAFTNFSSGVFATKLSMKINIWIEITILYEKRSAGTKNYANA